MTSLSWITLLAFFLSVAFCLGFREFAREWHLIDLPDHRKKHEGAVPLCGGIAIFLSFAIAAALPSGATGNANALAMLPGLLLILAVGVLDDRFNLPVMPRFAMQLFGGLLIIALAGVHRFHLGFDHADGEGSLMLAGPLLVVFALVFVVGLVNAINMSDGVDGLAGSASAASFFWLAVIGFGMGEHRLGLQTLVLMAACLGFLVFNMRHRWRVKASLFLGDGGSTLLGASLAGTILILSSGETAIAFPVLLWVVVVPVTDTLSLIVRRMAARRSPFSADRQHLHHLLMDAGLSCGQTAAVVMLFNLAGGGMAWAAVRFGLPNWAMLCMLVLPVALHTAFVLRMVKGTRIATASLAEAPSAKPNITFPGATS